MQRAAQKYYSLHLLLEVISGKIFFSLLVDVDSSEARPSSMLHKSEK